MQNLTAHYNILFNANELLHQKQTSYALSYIDNYDEILSVYQDTITKANTTDKDLDDIKVKANKIINLKEQSKYVGDAYLVLGKANYLGGNYFDAIEFFNYVTHNYAKQAGLTEEARVWKARSMIYLNQLPQAKLVLDSAIIGINPKKNITADVYATKLQYDIAVQEYPDAEEMAKQAINFSRDKSQRLRWTFILAQLQELNHKNTDAFNNYTRIIKSNATFEMAFNASLNRIRIEENQNGIKINRIDRLRNLLRNQNNNDFTDQIYYQIGQLYYTDKDITNAIKNYKLSVNYSRKNQNQKGLSYLRLADISFKNKADYISAKKYYDSTLFNLSPNYPGYQQIQKKSSNLQLLTDQYKIISQEDTLQALARLDEKTRVARIDAIVKAEMAQEQPAVASSSADPFNSTQPTVGGVGASSTTGSFYFYNTNAVSQGYSEFKRIWGNRKLEDNWRRSNRSNSDITSNTTRSVDQVAVTGQTTGTKNDPIANNLRQQLLQNLPLTSALLSQSNTRVYNAYFDIATFYRDILDDKAEAIATYELLLARFPENTDKPAIYYNLYRLYSDINSSRSDEYKARLLKNYAETPFAKILSDPEYGKRLNDENAEFNSFYNQVYDLYTQKEYGQLVTKADELLKRYPGNAFSAQLAYLRAIALGHQEKLELFKKDLQQINTTYPRDFLIGPLVNQHLAYIDMHQAEMATRTYALMDNDPNEAPFIPATVPQPQLSVQNPKSAVNVKPNSPPSSTSVNSTVKESSLFSTRDSTNYYFVNNVSTGTTNLASSRFGIGQFNRANFENNSIKHQLTNAGDDNQLIYIGRFYSLSTVKDYAKAIIPLLPEIMKVPKDKYTFFIITKENLDKLASKKLLDSYATYYEQNY